MNFGTAENLATIKSVAVQGPHVVVELDVNAFSLTRHGLEHPGPEQRGRAFVLYERYVNLHLLRMLLGNLKLLDDAVGKTAFEALIRTVLAFACEQALEPSQRARAARGCALAFARVKKTRGAGACESTAHQASPVFWLRQGLG